MVRRATQHKSTYLLSITRNPQSSRLSIETTGNNLGNAVIDYGLSSLVKNARSVVDLEHLRSEIRESDRVLFSLANFVSSAPVTDQQLHWMFEITNLIDQTGAIPVVASVGCQYHPLDAHFKVNQARLNFIKFLAKRSAFLGTRGALTSWILFRNGISNSWPIGDPGVLWALSAATKLKKSSTDSAVSSGLILTGNSRPLVRQLCEWEILNSSRRIVQSLEDGIEVDSNDRSLRYRPDLYTWALSPLPDQNEIAANLKSLNERARLPESLRHWRAMLRGSQLHISMRVHGCAVAYSVGVPTILLTHDFRTLELAHFHKFPSLSEHQFKSHLPIDKLITLARQRKPKERVIVRQLRNFRDFLVESGVGQRVPSTSHKGRRGTRTSATSDIGSPKKWTLEDSLNIVETAREAPLGKLLSLNESAPGYLSRSSLSIDLDGLRSLLGFELQENLSFKPLSE